MQWTQPWMPCPQRSPAGSDFALYHVCKSCLWQVDKEPLAIIVPSGSLEDMLLVHEQLPSPTQAGARRGLNTPAGLAHRLDFVRKSRLTLTCKSLQGYLRSSTEQKLSS